MDVVVVAICSSFMSTDAIDCAGDITNDLVTRVLVPKVNETLDLTCRSRDAATCLQNASADIDALLADTCTSAIAPDGGSVDGAPPGVGRCVLKVLGAINLALVTACGSTSAATCAINLIDKIDDGLRTACGAGTAGALPPGAAGCLVKVVVTIDFAMTTLCQTPEASGCIANTLGRIDSLLIAACGAPTGAPDSGWAIPVSLPGDPCVERTLDILHQTLTGSCGAATAAACIDRVDRLLRDTCSIVTGPVGATDPQPTDVLMKHPCTEIVLNTIERVLEDNCGAVDAVSCIERIDLLLRNTCGGQLIETPEGSDDPQPIDPVIYHECTEIVLNTIERVLEDNCGAVDAVSCIERIDLLLRNTCGGQLIETPEGSDDPQPIDPVIYHECTELVLKAIEHILETACGSTAPVTCVETLLSKIDTFATVACANAIPGSAASGPAEVPPLTTFGAPQAADACYQALWGFVNNLMTAACRSSDAQQCLINLFGTISNAVSSACRAAGPISATPSPTPTESSSPSPEPSPSSSLIVDLPEINHSCSDTLIKVLTPVLQEACETTDTEACVNGILIELLALLGQDAPLCEVAVDSYGYTCMAEPFSWEAPTSPISLSLSDDETSAGIDLSFDFNWYGEPKSQVFVSSNGLVCFTSSCEGVGPPPPPAPSAPNGLIACFWEDLDPAAGGTISYGVTGNSPDRTFVITYEDIRHKGETDPMQTNTFQVQLRENGDAACHLFDVDDDGDNYPTAVGTENGSGSTGLRYVSKPLDTSLVAVRFAAPAVPTGGTEECITEPADFIHPDNQDLITVETYCAQLDDGSGSIPPGIVVMTLNAGNGRQAVLPGKVAERIDKLRYKQPGAGRDDGIGRPPDVILLQEVSPAERKSILGKIRERFPKLRYLTAAGDPHRVQTCGGMTSISDTAILYRSTRVTQLGDPRGICTGRNREPTGPPPTLFYTDAETGSLLTCPTDDNGTDVNRKKHWMAAFEGNGWRFTVASLHFLVRECLEGVSQEEYRGFVNQWLVDVENALDNLAGDRGASMANVIGGDFNAKRCVQARDGQESQDCDNSEGGVHPWWSRLSSSSMYRDAIYAKHAAGGLTDQYRDGFVFRTDTTDYRKQRIDYLFVKGAAIHRASHDLSCGGDQSREQVGTLDRAKNCKTHPETSGYTSSAERYSDHRLVWTVFGGF